MKINIRFGMHRDTEILHQEKNLFDGIVMPAHILAYQSASASVFVTSLPRHQYFIDPMTFLLQTVCQDDLKASVRAMCESYHDDLVGRVEKVPSGSSMTPADFPELTEFCLGVVGFQRAKVSSGSSTKKAAKYIKRKGFGGANAGAPRLLLAPYFRFNAVGDQWYDLWIKCVSETRAIARKSEEVAAIIYCPPEILDTVEIDQVVRDLAGVETAILWLDDLNESSTAPDAIRRVRRLTEALHKASIHVEALYGGFLIALMAADGMEQLSHGILYSQHKAFVTTPGAGGVPERYYIPAFHAFRSLSQTDLILHKHPELLCDCSTCREVFQNNPDNIIYFADRPELLRQHFLTVRRAEVDSVTSTPRAALLKELEAVHSEYDASISSLPNPDAIVSHTQMSGLAYLKSWVEGLS